MPPDDERLDLRSLAPVDYETVVASVKHTGRLVVTHEAGESGGLGAEATAETPTEAKESLGPFAYAITGLRKLANFELARAVFRGGGFRMECDFVMFAVGSGVGTAAVQLARWRVARVVATASARRAA